MSSNAYMGIPREKIPWFPTIDPAKCVNCGACLDFCANEVMAAGEKTMTVVHPLNCVVGCSSCKRVCPSDAITFPSNEDLLAMLKDLREREGPSPSDSI